MQKILKNFSSVIAIAMTVFSVSCSKEIGSGNEVSAGKSGNEGKVQVNASVNMDISRATGILDNASDTKKVNSIQVFAFDSNGSLSDYKSNSSGSSVTLELNAGKEYTFYAVVNNAKGSGGWKNGEISSVTSESALNTIIMDLADNSSNDLLMFSREGTKKLVNTMNTSVSIYVTRLVSKVQIQKIVADFSSNPSMKNKSFKIDSIFMINNIKKETLIGTPVNSGYYCRAKFITSGADAILMDKLSTSFELSTNTGVTSDYTTQHSFFVYGNKDDIHTKLVVSCNWGGERTYYPVHIVGEDGKTLNSNCAYIIKQLKITGMGSSNPDDDIERVNVTASVTIYDWSTGFEKNIEL